MIQRLVKEASCGLVCLMLIMQPVVSALAETITIGKGTGIVWEGLPYNVTLNGPLNNSSLTGRYGLLAVSDSNVQCMSDGKLQGIGGYMAFPISGVPGIGLIPRATAVANYTRSNKIRQALNGTIGLPDTKGSSSTQSTVSTPYGYSWCLSPENADSSIFYSPTVARSVTLSGDWVMVADGTQQTSEGAIPPIYFGSYSTDSGGDLTTRILPYYLYLRVSTLECSVSTPTAINFGYVSRNTDAGAELALQPVGLIATCGQGSDRINANINLQFRAISGLYNNEPSRLALNQGGAYITGEIDGGVTGSGSCGATTGLKFDNTAIKLGSITSAESSKTLANQVIWRLCSGGSSLPAGAVTASTEMLVTFN